MSQSFRFAILASLGCTSNHLRGRLFLSSFLSRPAPAAQGRGRLYLFRAPKDPEVPHFKRFIIHLTAAPTPSLDLLVSPLCAQRQGLRHSVPGRFPARPQHEGRHPRQGRQGGPRRAGVLSGASSERQRYAALFLFISSRMTRRRVSSHFGVFPSTYSRRAELIKVW